MYTAPYVLIIGEKAAAGRDCSTAIKISCSYQGDRRRRSRLSLPRVDRVRAGVLQDALRSGRLLRLPGQGDILPLRRGLPFLYSFHVSRSKSKTFDGSVSNMHVNVKSGRVRGGGSHDPLPHPAPAQPLRIHHISRQLNHVNKTK